MSTSAPDQQAESGQQGQQEQQVDQGQQVDQAKEVDQEKESAEYWKAKARQHERRNRELAAAAKRLEEIEESTKTEQQKHADRLAKAEQRAKQAEQDALRFKIASKYKIDDEDAELFLTGTDEATLIKQAERLKARADDQQSQQRKQGWGSQEGRSPSRSSDPDQAFAADFFSQAGN